MPPLVFGLCRRLFRGRALEDWLMLAVLAATGLALLLSERFWAALPF